MIGVFFGVVLVLHGEFGSRVMLEFLLLSDMNIDMLWDRVYFFASLCVHVMGAFGEIFLSDLYRVLH